MLRITTWRITGTPQQATTPQAAIQTWNDMCSTIERLPGAGSVRWFFGSGGIVTVGETKSYALADAILETPSAQAAVGKVLALGYTIADDHFLLDAAKVMPFVTAQEQVPAQLARA